MARPLTQEEHSDELMRGIDWELDHFGAESLADFTASTIDGRCDEEHADYAYWSDVRKAFEAAGEQIGAINRRHKRVPPQRGNEPPAADPDAPGAGEAERTHRP